MRKLTAEYILDRMGKYDAEELAHEILKLTAKMKQHSIEWTTQEERVVWGWEKCKKKLGRAANDYHKLHYSLNR